MSLKSEKTLNDCYLVRDIILRREGYDSYESFLKSEYWQGIRKKTQLAKYKDNYKKCSHCKSKENLNLHHINYRWLLTKRELSAITCLCEKCHKAVHNFANEHQITISNATQIHNDKYKEENLEIGKTMDDLYKEHCISKFINWKTPIPDNVYLTQEECDFLNGKF